MLLVEELDLFYGDAQALDRVSLSVDQGSIVAIVGANGAGKTSLIQTIAGMHRPARGSIRFRGTEIGGLPSHRVCNLGIGQVAEGRQIFPTLSVNENLEVGAMLPRVCARKRAYHAERQRRGAAGGRSGAPGLSRAIGPRAELAAHQGRKPRQSQRQRRTGNEAAPQARGFALRGPSRQRRTGQGAGQLRFGNAGQAVGRERHFAEYFLVGGENLNGRGAQNNLPGQLSRRDDPRRRWQPLTRGNVRSSGGGTNFASL